MSHPTNPPDRDEPTRPALATRVRQLARVETVFHEAMACAPEDREALLRDACGDDAALLDTLIRMVRHAEAGETDLGRDIGALASDLAAPRDRSGERIGHYRLVVRIRFGGMAEVYRAARDDGEFAHDVALKIVRADRVPRRLAERFARERALLARLRHPNICQIFDGGTTEQGEPFLVMERIDGETFLDACHDPGRDWRDVTALFLDLCSGVAYAHRQLIVHRDIKPDNILVEASGSGTVKLLDFGIASALSDPANEDPAAAPDDSSPDAADSWFSPEYAAPEVAAGSIGDTTVDVYSLGILLGQLADRFPAARARELALITARATADDPASRYATVGLLAEDVRRTRDREPISLLADRGGYVARRFLQRHAVWIGVATAAVLALALGLAREVQLRRTAQAATAQAEVERDKAQAVTDFMIAMYDAANPDLNAGETPALHALLARQVAALERAEDMDPATRVDLWHALGQAQAGLGQFAEGNESLALAIASLKGSDRTGTRTWARIQIDRAGYLRRLGDVEGAEALLDAVDARWSSWGGATRAPDLASRVFAARAAIEQGERRLERAEEHIRRALALRRQASSEPEDLVRPLATLGAIQSAQGHTRPALATFHEAHDLYRASGAQPDLALIAVLGWLGITHDRLGEPEAGEPYLRDAIAHAEQLFPTPNTRLAATYNNLGGMLLANGRLREAEPWLAKAKTTLEDANATDASIYRVLVGNLGKLAHARDDFDSARRHLEASLTAYVARYGPDHPRVGPPHASLALLDIVDGRPAAGLERVSQGLALLRQGNATANARIPISMLYAARAHASLGNPTEADRLIAEAIALVETHHGDNPRVRYATEWQRGEALWALRRVDDATIAYRNASEAYIDAGAADHPGQARCQLRLAEIALMAGDHAAARARLAGARPSLERELIETSDTLQHLDDLSRRLAEGLTEG